MILLMKGLVLVLKSVPHTEKEIDEFIFEDYIPQQQTGSGIIII
jgi:hypothetical protein